MNKASRRKLHQSINSLDNDQVAAIVWQNFPRARGKEIDQLAKGIISDAHRQVSPRPHLPRKRG
jgi:hypothetical protein